MTYSSMSNGSVKKNIQDSMVLLTLILLSVCAVDMFHILSADPSLPLMSPIQRFIVSWLGAGIVGGILQGAWLFLSHAEEGTLFLYSKKINRGIRWFLNSNMVVCGIFMLYALAFKIAFMMGINLIYLLVPSPY